MIDRFLLAIDVRFTWEEFLRAAAITWHMRRQLRQKGLRLQEGFTWLLMFKLVLSASVTVRERRELADRYDPTASKPTVKSDI
jgi:hypothetical protein